MLWCRPWWQSMKFREKHDDTVEHHTWQNLFRLLESLSKIEKNCSKHGNWFLTQWPCSNIVAEPARSSHSERSSTIMELPIKVKTCYQNCLFVAWVLLWLPRGFRISRVYIRSTFTIDELARRENQFWIFVTDHWVLSRRTNFWEIAQNRQKSHCWSFFSDFALNKWS
jgi:hypothetical protein